MGRPPLNWISRVARESYQALNKNVLGDSARTDRIGDFYCGYPFVESSSVGAGHHRYC